MLESIGPIAGAILFTITSALAAYHAWIRPGYRADMEARHARDTR